MVGTLLLGRRARRFSRHFWAGAALCSLLAPLACTRDTGRPRALVLVVIDTLRGDRLGYVGYSPAVTPTLDSLAASGVQFRDAQSPAPITLASISSILTGRYPFHHGVRDNERFALRPEEETLTERFRAAGFRTGAIVASAVLAADRGLNQGFESYDDAFEGPYPVYTPSLGPLAEEFGRTRRRADEVTDRAIARLDGFGEEPFFLFVHYFDVHMYYDPPPRFAARHPGAPYDGEVSFVDHEIGRLLAAVRRRPDALVVVVADHGESQNEHGEPQHGFLLYQATLHVPFIASGPGVPAGAVRSDLVSLVDVEPTLARVFGLPAADAPRDGVPLDWATPRGGSAPIYAETFHTLLSQNWSELRSVRRGAWKLIRGPESELYNLESDPNETTPVENAERTADLGRMLDGMIVGDDPEAVVLQARDAGDPARRELLESLGYVGTGGAPSGSAKTRPNPRDALPGWVDLQWAKELTRTAATLAASGRAIEGMALVDSALGLAPDLPEPYLARARMWIEGGDLRRAARDCRTALEHDPRLVPALSLLAQIAEKGGRGEEAYRVWSRVVQASPEDETALAFLAQWHLSRNEPYLALSLLRQLVSKEPGNPAAQFNLAVTAYGQDRPREAREHFQVFLELAPDDPQAGRVQELLEDLDPPGTRGM